MNKLLRMGRWNSGLLSAMFLLNGLTAFYNDSGLFGIINLAAAFFTTREAFIFHEAIQQLEKENK